jgi:NADH dehydrogenase FAD-containing subunit
MAKSQEQVKSREQEKSRKRHRVVIVGAGFAGFHAARELSSLVALPRPKSS